MSGGVDSSCTAALLVEAGYEVIGVTLQLYDHGAATRPQGRLLRRPGHPRCAPRRRAPRHPALRARFRAALPRAGDRRISPTSYAAGRTPIPCVRCNQRVKFKDLLQIARDLGADALATGHYVAPRSRETGGPSCTAPPMRARDQSYFLFATTRAQLDFLRFPLGALREGARPGRWPRASRCRSPPSPTARTSASCRAAATRGVVERLRPDAAEPGEIVHVDGRVLGRHDGRDGLHRRPAPRPRGRDRRAAVRGPPGARAAAGGGRPEERAAVPPGRAVRASTGWATGRCRADGIAVEVKHRAQEPAVAARVWSRPATAARAVAFEAPQAGVAPGQACVFYQGTRVLGGGWIERAPLACRTLDGAAARSLHPASAWGGVAQLVEQWNHNPWVGGSSPSSATKQINDLGASGRLFHVANPRDKNRAFPPFSLRCRRLLRHIRDMGGDRTGRRLGRPPAAPSSGVRTFRLSRHVARAGRRAW